MNPKKEIVDLRNAPKKTVIPTKSFYSPNPQHIKPGGFQVIKGIKNNFKRNK